MFRAPTTHAEGSGSYTACVQDFSKFSQFTQQGMGSRLAPEQSQGDKEKEWHPTLVAPSPIQVGCLTGTSPHSHLLLLYISTLYLYIDGRTKQIPPNSCLHRRRGEFEVYRDKGVVYPLSHSQIAVAASITSQLWVIMMSKTPPLLLAPRPPILYQTTIIVTHRVILPWF